MSVDDLFVFDVDKRAKIGNGSGDQSQSPERDKLDEEVRDEGRKEGLRKNTPSV
jgi:hypothetical protein